jgi:hypothetical protein
MNTQTELLTSILNCDRGDLNAFCDILINLGIKPGDVITKARDMGLEPLYLPSLLEAVKIMEEGK